MSSAPRVYHGMLDSLYHTLQPEFVEHLERAIWTSKTGRYQDALDIFDKYLQPALDVPVVLLELSYLHYANFRYRTLCDLLEPRLDSIKQDNPAMLDEPEWRLLTLIYSVGANRCRGWMEPGLRELRRTQEWLSELPVSQYTQLHVHCAWRFVIAYLMTRLQTGLEGNLDDYHRIPLPEDFSSDVEWQGLGDLRRELAKQGRWKEASAIFKPELNRTHLKQRRAVAEEFLKQLDGCSSLEKSNMVASVRLQMGKAMIEIHDLKTAKEDLELCVAALKQWCADVGLGSNAILPLHFEVEQVQLGFMPDYKEKLAAAVNLAQRMSEFGHCNYSSCLDVAAEAASKAAELTRNSDYWKQCLALRERLERNNEHVTGDICDLSIHAYQVHSLAQHTNVDAQKAIEWIDGFLLKYPDFKAPRVMESLYTRKAILLSTLRDLEGSEAAAAEALKWDALVGSWTGVNNSNRSNIVAPGDGALGEVPYDSEEDNDDGEGFLDGWRNTYGLDRPSMATKKMIEFALQDVDAGRLPIADVCLVFDLPTNIEANVLEVELKRLQEQEQELLFRRLWLPQSEEDLTFEPRYGFIRKWLQKPVRGSRDRRLMCLLRFLDLHKEFASDASFWKLAIRDCENMLSLWESLPRMLKEFTSSWQWAWQAAIAWNYWSIFIRGGRWTLFDNFGYLVEIDKRCDLAIDGYRKTNQITGVANIERLQAQIGLLTMRRLIIYKTLSTQETRTQLEDRVMEMSEAIFGELPEAEKAIPMVKKEGLKLLTEADEIFSSTEREASWQDGLEGIEKRLELYRMQMSYTTTRYAVRLWVEGVDEFSEEAKVAVWNLTQKYKARLLSLAIGMYRPNPPSLVMRIQASKKEAPVYQEMIDLQREIDEANPKDRFFMRLRLDEHRKKMKEYPLLRQLIELREGTPLSLDGLENITNHLEDDVILVDWFYLDPLFDHGKLFLLTARKGQAPTVDEIRIDVQAVEDWKKDHLNASSWFKDKRAPKLASSVARASFNDICGAIIKPLEERTKEGDVLVLCPTEFLNGMPLHALEIDDEALIRRNPCVYIHSHSLLRPCYSAAQYASDKESPVNAKFLSGIAGIGQDAVKFAAGRDSIVKLTEQLQGTSMIDESATKSNFLEHARQSRLLHIQTHCRWDSSNPLDHHIEFAAQSGEEGKHEKLTARDVFALRFQQGSHINVIACSGALTDIKAGDEVMGLVPALLYSGASSVVSTLWPIPDDAGAKFSEVFFANFNEQRKQEGTKWINVAKAVQQAVVALDPEQNLGLLRWAPFVLNGYWMFAFMAFKDVQNNLDKVEEFLALSSRFFERLSIIKGSECRNGPLGQAIVRVFSAQLSAYTVIHEMIGRKSARISNFANHAAIRSTQDAAIHIDEKTKKLCEMLRKWREQQSENVISIFKSNLKIEMEIRSNHAVTMDGIQAIQYGLKDITSTMSKANARNKKDTESRSEPKGTEKRKQTSKLGGIGDISDKKAQALRPLKAFFDDEKNESLNWSTAHKENIALHRDHKDEFVIGTAEWLFTEPAWEQWITGENFLLWLRRVDGVGKFFLSFASVRKLLDQADGSAVTFFHFREDVTCLQSVRNAIACTALQVAESDLKYAKYVSTQLADDVNDADEPTPWQRFFLSAFGNTVNGLNADNVADNLKEKNSAKKVIRRRISKQADGMLYADHMLRRLSSIGRKGAVLENLGQVPLDLTQLYNFMLDECRRGRSKEQHDALKKLFAWTAFSKRPLSLAQASELVALTITEGGIDIEDQIIGRSARKMTKKIMTKNQ
ncbi:hypothetical protein N0V90_011310 [Kalmusia sp. IMI 367209]|nr:hypothetical protein N0V90_011310 [Kalmusia sp. IMI 367209]